MKMNSHGGNIYKKAKELGLSESQLIDFSANISPLGLPDHIREAMIRSIDGLINYPDPDCTKLKTQIAGADQVDMGHITCGNGGADLLYRLAFGLKPGKVLLPVPAFVEYEEACTAAGAQMIYYRMDEELRVREDFLDHITSDIDLIILCNPNNPTGLLTPRDLLLKVLNKARDAGCLVLVDECFLEICQDEELYTLKPYIGKYSNLIILKSFTKMYAMPGVRLGYVLCSDPEVIGKINHAGQAWSVSYIAQQAGIAALSQPEYKEAVIAEVAKELAFMKKELARLPLDLYDGQANYLFFRTPGITNLDRRLEKYGIMIRNCSNYVNLGPDYWRVGVRNHEENVTLIQAIRECLGVS
ncbi:MAG: threonine-phosphate decarboxylase [Eubacterium sp.]|nr:threonine-phosphate decarboxylase [Eubacterium sp.]